MITEAQLEDSILDWLGDLGWEPAMGAELESQRESLGDLVLREDLMFALRNLNPSVPDQHLHEAAANMLQVRSQDPLAENRDSTSSSCTDTAASTISTPRAARRTPPSVCSARSSRTPTLHTLFLDRPLKGALLMQTLARVNRTFRGKPDGLLVAYAPLAENLSRALQEYTATDQATRPVGRDAKEAERVALELIEALRSLLAGCDWRAVLACHDKDAALKAVSTAVEYLRTPGSQAGEGGAGINERFRELSSRLACMWTLAGGSERLAQVAGEVRFYKEVRTWMAKLDARAREAAGGPLPEQIVRTLRGAVAQATAAGDITDLYQAAGLPMPTIQTLNPQMLDEMVQAPTPHLAVEALRNLLVKEAKTVARNNVVRQGLQRAHQRADDQVQESADHHRRCDL